MSPSTKAPHIQGGKKKRSIVSVADPTDLISNMELAKISMDETPALDSDEILKLNRKQRSQGVKWHLRLPFSKGKKKDKEKRSSSPERTPLSPKVKIAKQSDNRNKRFSRALAGNLSLSHFLPIYCPLLVSLSTALTLSLSPPLLYSLPFLPECNA